MDRLRERLEAAAAAGTPGRGVLDELRFELKRGDAWEQHLASRIEDGLDAQTVAWEEFVRGLLSEQEDAADARVAAAARASIEAGERVVPWDEVKAEAGET
jgi:hypothetical protein